VIALLAVMLAHYSFAAESGNSSGSFRNIDLSWKDEHLDGDLRNVPLDALLREMSSVVGFEVVIKGNANQTVDISFNKLTLDQCIKKLMRLANCNYSIVWDPEVSHGIKKLIVYPSDTTARSERAPGDQYKSTRVPARSSSRNENRVLSTPPFSPETSEEKSPQETEEERIQEVEQEPRREDAQQPGRENAQGKTFRGSQEDLKDFVDKMAAENQLDPEEYERIRRQMEEQKQ
jgi:hypothetical protein